VVTHLVPSVASTPGCGVEEEGEEHTRTGCAAGKRRERSAGSVQQHVKRGAECEGRHISPPRESAFWYGTWSSVYAHPDAVTSLASSITEATRVYIAGYITNEEACNASSAKE
jgi:hypothetical protein